MNIYSLPVRLGLATLALSTATVLSFAQAPADPTAVPPPTAPGAPAPAVAGPRHSGHREGLTARQQKRLDRLVATCGLSDVQKGQVKELMILSRHHRLHHRPDGYRAEAMNRHEMRHAFRSILTPEQFAKLQSARAARLQARAGQTAVPNAAPATP